MDATERDTWAEIVELAERLQGRLVLVPMSGYTLLRYRRELRKLRSLAERRIWQLDIEQALRDGGAEEVTR